MDPFFLWIEHSGLSKWLRESPSLLAFPTVLTLHTISMGFLAGTSAALDLRILGIAPGIPLAPMVRFFGVMWLSFCVSAASGVGLLIAYPSKALTNPLFYVKLAFIAFAIVNLRALRKHAFADGTPDFAPAPRKAKILATTSLICWVGVIASGRFLAYTFVRLLTFSD